MILFTNHTVHAGVKSYEKHGGQYSSHLRMFAYIVKEGHYQTQDTITKVLHYLVLCLLKNQDSAT